MTERIFLQRRAEHVERLCVSTSVDLAVFPSAVIRAYDFSILDLQRVRKQCAPQRLYFFVGGLFFLRMFVQC